MLGWLDIFGVFLLWNHSAYCISLNISSYSPELCQFCRTSQFSEACSAYRLYISLGSSPNMAPIWRNIIRSRPNLFHPEPAEFCELCSAQKSATEIFRLRCAFKPPRHISIEWRDSLPSISACKVICMRASGIQMASSGTRAGVSTGYQRLPKEEPDAVLHKILYWRQLTVHVRVVWFWADLDLLQTMCLAGATKLDKCSTLICNVLYCTKLN